MTAGQAGSADYEPAPPVQRSFQVAKATVDLSSRASAPVVLGGRISDSATIAGGGAPTGTLTFHAYGPEDEGCSAAPAYTSEPVEVEGDGEYTSEPAFVPTVTGTYRFTVEYSGDAGNAATTSACEAVGESTAVGKAPTQTALGISPDPAPFGSAVTLTATVTGFGSGGSVTFFDGGSPLASVPLGTDGTASYPTTALGTGSHQISATYSGDAHNLESVSPIIEETILAPAASPPPAAPAPSAAPAPRSPSPTAPATRTPRTTRAALATPSASMTRPRARRSSAASTALPSSPAPRRRSIAA